MFWASTRHGRSLDQDLEGREHILQMLVGAGRGFRRMPMLPCGCSTRPCRCDSWALLPVAPRLGGRDGSRPLQPSSLDTRAFILLEGVACQEQGLGEDNAGIRVAFPSGSQVGGRRQGF